MGKLAAHGNARSAVTLSGVYHLMRPSRELVHAALIWASVAARFHGYGLPAERPAGLRGLVRSD